MRLAELSLEFDLLYNNISSNQAPGLNEYEKSVFLTQASESVISDIYKGVGADSFESTEEVTRYLSSLVKTSSHSLESKDVKGIVKNKTYSVDISKVEDLWFIVYESATVNTDKCGERNVMVIPTTHDKLHREASNPFRGPNMNKILRLSSGNKIELISSYPVTEYYFRYLSRPYPIILEDLSNYGVSINGETTPKELEIPESLHRIILVRATQLAKASWAS